MTKTALLATLVFLVSAQIGYADEVSGQGQTVKLKCYVPFGSERMYFEYDLKARPGMAVVGPGIVSIHGTLASSQYFTPNHLYDDAVSGSDLDLVVAPGLCSVFETVPKKD